MPSMRQCAFALLMLALVVGPLAALAQQDTTPINLGDTVAGALEAGSLSAPFTLSGSRGDLVTIRLESDDFDGYLTLFDPGLNELAADDDSAGGTNPSILDFALPTAGEFTILVDSYNGLQTGAFTLSVTGTAAPQAVQTPPATAGADTILFDTGLELGDSIDGTITPDVTAVAYAFQGRLGQRVTIDLTSSAFDSYLILNDESGGELASDDDSGGNLNARIEDFELPADGTYTILAGSYGGGVEGAFTVSVQDAGAALQPTVEATPAATPTLIPTPESLVTPQPPDGDSILINIGETTSSTIPDFAGSTTFVFDGLAGQIVTITLESDTFDAYLQLLDADGAILAEDDDSAGILNAQISDFILAAAGRYRINVGSFSGAASGDFLLTLAQTGFGDVPSMVVTAQTVTSSGGAIAVGDTVYGTLPDDTRVAPFTFEGRAGDVVTITLSSSAFDSYLSLQNADGQEVAYDDDSGGDLNARIENFSLPADSTYTIEATSFGSFVSGNFTLTLEGRAVVQSDGGTAITLGDNVSGSLNDGARSAAYSFTGSAGQIVRLTLESDAFDPYLTLLDPNRNEIANDDDSAGNLNARIADFVLPDSGTYTIVVAAVGDYGSGAFILSTAAAAIQPTVEPTPVVSPPGTISVGETVASTLNDGPNAHTFAGRAGQVVTIELQSSAFDAYLQLLSADETELASDDDSAGNLNARIAAFSLPADGTYIILASSFDNTATGDYTLILTEGGVVVPPIALTAVPSSTQLAFGDRLDGVLSGGDLSAVYTFAGEAGQIVTITATSDDFDAYLRLRDPDGIELTSDDDSAGSLNARISFFRLPQNGVYTIVVESYDSEAGNYSLHLRPGRLIPIEYRQTADEALSPDEQTIGYRFTGAAGDVIIITLKSSAFDAYLSLAQADSQNSYALITDDDSGGGSDARIGPFTLPETGAYIITVSSYDSTEFGPYIIQLDRAILSPIVFDQQMVVDITPQTTAVYFQFEGVIGDVISIRAQSDGSVDTSLSLTGPDNYEIISDDDSGPDFDPEISRVVLDTDGMYTLALLPYAPGDSGQVVLTLTRAPIRSLDDGPQDVRLNDKVYQDVLTFTAVAGQEYQLWVRVQAGVASPTVTLTQAGTMVATASASSSTALLLAFVALEDGPVNVQITDYSYEKVVLTVSVETVGE